MRKTDHVGTMKASKRVSNRTLALPTATCSGTVLDLKCPTGKEGHEAFNDHQTH